MTKPTFYDCGICGHWHPVDWNGDCRDDANRFTTSQLEDTYGNQDDGWIGIDPFHVFLVEPSDPTAAQLDPGWYGQFDAMVRT